MQKEELVAKLKEISASLHTITESLIPTLSPAIEGSVKIKSSIKINTTIELGTEHFYLQPYAKKCIVLHHTAGTSVEGAVNHWRNETARIGTAYLISKQGDIFKVFPDNVWAYHTGRGANADVRSIGIELVNEGPLKKFTNNFYWWPNQFTQPYLGNPDKVHPSEGWRGYSFWAPYTEEQYQSLSHLLKYLTDKYDIPYVRVKDGDARQEPTKISGITHHAAMRDDKTDLSPAFSWKRIGL